MVKLLRKRYIGFRIMSEKPYTRHEILKLILEELRLIGRNDANKIRVRLLEYEEEKCVGILQCGHESVDKIRRLLDSVNEKNREVMIKSLGVSGTVKSLRRKFLDKTC